MYYICAAITLISASISLYFSVLTVSKSEGEGKITALYVTARSFALICVSIVPFFVLSKELVSITAAAMILVQFLDGWIGIKIGDKFETLGPFITAAVHLVVLIIYLS